MDGNEIFMNLQTDFGLKKVFGTVAHKKALILFLNSLFSEEGIRIDDVVYHDKEVLPEDKSDDDITKRGKRIIYDVYCTTNNHSHHFILEMQQAVNIFFTDRALYYSVRAMSTQGKSGWDYRLCPVYSIFILGFNLKGFSKQLIHDFRLRDINTNELLSDKLRMIFISLPEVKRTWEECETNYDKILFIVKNIHKMTKDSKPYKSGEFNDIFEASEISSLAAEDVVLYSQSYAKMHEDKLCMEYAVEQAEARGRAEGEARGRAEGEMESKINIAGKMYDNGFDHSLIKKLTGLDPHEYC